MLPKIICGPILRRTEDTGFYVWLALSQPIERVSGFAYMANQIDKPIGKGQQSTIPFGENLHVVLLRISPLRPEGFPSDEILCYDLLLNEQSILRNTPLGKSISYSPYALPSFFIQSDKTPLNILFGSCRKIHGAGYDCLTRGDDVIDTTAEDISKRPAALFLGGDQIYADDVSSVMMPMILNIAQKLLKDEQLLETEVEKPYKFGSRGYLLKELGLEKLSHHADNHVIKFSEFAALYCLSWNSDIWSSDWLQNAEKLQTEKAYFTCKGESPKSKSVKKRLTRHAREIASVQNYLKELPAVRRLLANVPTYMIFDDHEVTDDWNITFDWKEKMIDAPLGSQLLSNGLAAYWLFQAWGNNPKAFNDSFVRDMVKFTQASGSNKPNIHNEYIDFYGIKAFGFRQWDFMTPTYPGALFLDTRTKRFYEFYGDTRESFVSLEKIKDIIANGTNKVINFCLKVGNILIPGKEKEFTQRLPPRLIKRKHLEYLKENYAEQLKHQIFFLVSATPIFGIQRIEDTFRIGERFTSVYRWDKESWAANYLGYLGILKFLINDVQAKHCIVLSGDVHYGFVNQCTVRLDSKTDKQNAVKFTQITSSSLKNNSRDLLGSIAVQLLQALEENIKPLKTI